MAVDVSLSESKKVQMPGKFRLTCCDMTLSDSSLGLRRWAHDFRESVPRTQQYGMCVLGLYTGLRKISVR